MIGLIRGCITLALLLLFMALLVWAYSRRRRPLFEYMATLPLEDAP